MTTDATSPNAATATPASPVVRDTRVANARRLTSPAELEAQLPVPDASRATTADARDAIANILAGRDERLLVICGPCSVHDVDAAEDYANRLLELHHEVQDRMLLVMRCYFEKPRTTTGWKGLINDPFLYSQREFDMATGLSEARKLLIRVTQSGLPVATEFLDPFTPQYLDEMVSWAAIGARTTESQTHRQMASGLSMPVGFKNSTDGNTAVAINAMQSARSPHAFLGIDRDGRTCVVETRGNPDGHLILRGGAGHPNYHPDSVASAAHGLERSGLRPALMVDCSHANSGKDHDQQQAVWRSILDQRRAGRTPIIGAMIESNLEPGSQAFSRDPARLAYGVSITDACIGWVQTHELLHQAYQALG